MRSWQSILPGLQLALVLSTCAAAFVPLAADTGCGDPAITYTPAAATTGKGSSTTEPKRAEAKALVDLSNQIGGASGVTCKLCPGTNEQCERTEDEVIPAGGSSQVSAPPAVWNTTTMKWEAEATYTPGVPANSWTIKCHSCP
jgi:hypothetical protein